MKKPKLNFGAGGIQGWLAQHVEKIVLAVVVGLMGFFIYSGYSKEGYTKNPAELLAKAQSAEDHVSRDTSLTLISTTKRDRFEPYKERVEQSQRPTASSEYSIMPFNPTMFPPTQPRQDPELFAPLNVEVEGFLVSVHETVEDDEDPYQNDKNSAPTKRAATTPKKEKKKDKDADKSGMAGMMAPPGEKGKGPRGKGGGGPPGVGSTPPGMESGDDLLGGGPSTPGMGGMGAMGGGMSASSSVSEAYLQKYVRGYRPGGGGFSMSGPSSGGDKGIGVSRYVIAVKAVIPHQKLVDEYRRVFAEAQGFDPVRDTPRYVYYNVERAEVGADPNAEPTWEAIRVKDAWTNHMQNWTGTMTEVADERYLDAVLTQPMPPAMLVDPIRFGLHSEVPRAITATEATDDGTEGKKKKSGKTKEEGGDDSPDAPPGNNFAGGPGGPGGMAPPGMGAGGPGLGGLGMGKAGAGGMTPPGMGAGGPGGMTPPGMMGGGPGMGGVMMGGPGMGGAMMGGMSYGNVAETVKYKMVRFYDFDVDPKKQYRYRVRVWIEDPNHPQADEMAPSAKILSTKVAERVKALDDKEKAGGRRVYYRLTEWSKASAPVGLPISTKFVAGQVVPGSTLELREHKLFVPTGEPSATVLPIVWDTKRAVDIPGYADVPDEPKNPNDKEKPSAYRGTVLNFKKDARVLRPDTLELKVLEKYPFRTNAVVVDLRPGAPIRDGDKKPAKDKDKKELNSAGEILIVDAQGNLIVRNELDDTEDYRKFMFTDEDKPATGGDLVGGGGAMAPPGGGGGVPPGDAMMEAMKGGGGDLLGGPGKGGKGKPPKSK